MTKHQEIQLSALKRGTKPRVGMAFRCTEEIRKNIEKFAREKCITSSQALEFIVRCFFDENGDDNERNI